MKCPSCGYAVSHDDNSCLSQIRDISRIHHHIEFDEWLQDLDRALKDALIKRKIEYDAVAVLLLSWEDSDMPFIDREIERLARVFKEIYDYDVEHWKIPSLDADEKTLDKVRQFLAVYGKQENLIIVYYAGHGRPGNVSGGPPIWHPKKSTQDTEELDTSSIHQQLTRARANSPDVLLLYDCCHPLSAHVSNYKETRAVVECIFAGGFESQVPIAGPDSFTSALTDELSIAAKANKRLPVTELHRRLICRLQGWQQRIVFDRNNMIRRDREGNPVFTQQVRVTPAHLFLSTRARSICLSPKSLYQIDHGSLMQEIPSTDISDDTGGDDQQAWPKSLLAIRCSSNPSDRHNLVNWMREAPDNVVDIDFIGLLPSFSNLLLIAVPVGVWDLLSDFPAVSFVSFITKQNSPSEETRHLRRLLRVTQGSDNTAEQAGQISRGNLIEYNSDDSRPSSHMSSTSKPGSNTEDVNLVDASEEIETVKAIIPIKNEDEMEIDSNIAGLSSGSPLADTSEMAKKIDRLQGELIDQERDSSAKIRLLKEDIAKSNHDTSQWKSKFDEVLRSYDDYKRQILERDTRLESKDNTIEIQDKIQNRNAEDQKAVLLRERESLVTDLSKAIAANKAWSEEAARLSHANGHLSREAEVLRDEINRLRHSISLENDHQIKGLKRRIKALENELREQERVSAAETLHLKEYIAKSNQVASHWKSKFETLKRNYDIVRRHLFERDAQLERRNEVVEVQDVTIRRLRDMLERHRGL